LQPYIAGVPAAVLVLVALLTLIFVGVYAIQGTRVFMQLRAALTALKRFEGRAKRPSIKELDEAFIGKPIKHLWVEYADTLHALHKAVSADGQALQEVRATVPAETFFTKEVLVDSRLFDEFTKHLPGILTGLGIIGTFAGLLDGLLKFNPTSASSAVAGLKPLLDGVAHAFVASAVAITAAMFITFVSRLTLASFYKRVEHINQSIDVLFATGAGEEYLSRLVQASEKSEAHAAQLKQALVEDLSKLMTNLTERQIAAQAAASQSLGTIITSSLEPPLMRMTDAMRTQSEGNTQAVSTALETLLTGFMARLEDTFGGQIRGINDQMDRSLQAVDGVRAALVKLVEDIDKSGQNAQQRLTDSLESAMKTAAATQGALTEQMKEFIAEFRRSMDDESEKSRRSMEATMRTVLEQLGKAVGQMESVRATAATEEGARHERLTQHTQQTLGELSSQVESILHTVSDQVAATQRNIQEISTVTLTAIDGMQDGARTMNAAAQRFETAGSSVSAVFDRSSELSKQLQSSSNALQATSTTLRAGFDQFESSRKATESHLAALGALVENAKREAGASRQLVTDLERVVQQLRDAEKQSLEYLEGVNEALAEAFEKFTVQLAGAVRESTKQTDTHLGNGVQQLTGVVQEISAMVGRLRKVA
jgi:hypothetical protein